MRVPSTTFGRTSALRALVTLEELHRALVLFRGLPCAEGSEVASAAGLRVRLARVQPKFPVLQLADHRPERSKKPTCRGLGSSEGPPCATDVSRCPAACLSASRFRRRGRRESSDAQSPPAACSDRTHRTSESTCSGD